MSCFPSHFPALQSKGPLECSGCFLISMEHEKIRVNQVVPWKLTVENSCNGTPLKMINMICGAFYELQSSVPLKPSISLFCLYFDHALLVIWHKKQISYL